MTGGSRQRGAAAGVFALALLLYLSTLPAAGYNSDVYDFIESVRDGAPQRLFHVHHLLFNALGRAWSTAWRALGAELPLRSLLRALCAVLGAATVLVFHRLISRVPVPPGPRGLAAACLATCFAIWMFSVDFEVYVASTLFLTAALAVLWRRPEVSVGMALGAGALLAAGTLFHQMGVLFSAVVVVAVAQSEGPSRQRAARAALAVATGGVLTLLPYIVVGALWYDVRGPGDFVVWTLGYSLRGYGEGLHPLAVAMAVVGQGRSLVFFGHVLRALQEGSSWRLPGLGLVAVTGLVWALGAWGALAGWRRTPQGRRRWLPLLTWYLIYAAFSLWWEPENPEFWVTATVPLVALWAGGLALAGGRWRWLVGAAALIGFVSNHADIRARRDPDFDPDVRAVRAIASRVGEEAVISPPSFSARAALFAPQTRWLNLYRVLQTAEPTREAALRRLVEAVEAERAAGRRVFLYAEAVNHRMRSLFPHADAVVEELATRYALEPRFEVEMPYDPSGEFGALARVRPVAVFELVPNAPQDPPPGPRG